MTMNHQNPPIQILKDKELYVFDMDGTIYLGKIVFDFAIRFIENLRAAGKRVLFFTNNASRSTDVYLEKLTRLGFSPTAEEIARREVVKTTYENARARGERVYFVDGETVFGIFGGDGGSVDGCPPNDLGFACVAAALAPIFAEIYGEK